MGADIKITPGAGFPRVNDIRPLSDLFARAADRLAHLASLFADSCCGYICGQAGV